MRSTSFLYVFVLLCEAEKWKTELKEKSDKEQLNIKTMVLLSEKSVPEDTLEKHKKTLEQELTTFWVYLVSDSTPISE